MWKEFLICASLPDLTDNKEHDANVSCPGDVGSLPELPDQWTVRHMGKGHFDYFVHGGSKITFVLTLYFLYLRAFCDYQRVFFAKALGCVLFLLCFNEHPFEDSAKLRIINANFHIPAADTKYTVFHDLIRKFLPAVVMELLADVKSCRLSIDHFCVGSLSLICPYE